MTPCAHYTTEHGLCGETPTRLYLPGRRCAAHTPARLAGRPETVPDPARTLEGLRKAAKVEAKRDRLHREQVALEPGWTNLQPPLVSPLGWVSRPGRMFTSADVDPAKVHRAQRRVGDELTRRAQIARVARREATS